MNGKSPPKMFYDLRIPEPVLFSLVIELKSKWHSVAFLFKGIEGNDGKKETLDEFIKEN